MDEQYKSAPGHVRDAILETLSASGSAMSVQEIAARVEAAIGPTPASSIRSYLRLNTPSLFVRERRGVYRAKQKYSESLRQKYFAELERKEQPVAMGAAELVHDDCFSWLEARGSNSIHAVLTDPPYGLHEYTGEQQRKLRDGKGGVWRIPPSFDGHRRSPLPRFTTLDRDQLDEIAQFFVALTKTLMPVLVPGANVVIASNPLVSHIVANAVCEGGLERRGEIIRLTMTMRGGDRPKGAHDEFGNISVLPRSMWEPWLVFRKPLDGRVQDNLGTWGTGGFRRPANGKPFGDVISSSPTRPKERELAPHPSLKPQAFLRQVARGILPLGKGVVLDPFAGAGSALAACNRVGYASIGVERDPEYFKMAVTAIPKLSNYGTGEC